MCVFVSAPAAMLTAQEVEEWRASLRADTATAARALGRLPDAIATELAADLVALLRRDDIGLRNAAVAWLCRHPEVADVAFAALRELRSSTDPEFSRAAGVVYAAVLEHRATTLDALREQLRDESRRGSALDALRKYPDRGIALLPELLALQPLVHADAVLRRLVLEDRARVEAAVVAAIDAGGDVDALVVYLELAATDLQRHVARLAAALPPRERRTGRTMMVLTRLVAEGAPPPPRWVEILRHDDPDNNRYHLLQELGRRHVPDALWPDLMPLLERPDTCLVVGEMVLDRGRRAVELAGALRAALAQAPLDLVVELADIAAQLGPATRDCATVLLPLLSTRREEVLVTLILTLGQIGNDSGEVLAALEGLRAHPDADVRRAAEIAARQLGAALPRELEQAPTERLLRDVATQAWHQALLAELELAARGVSPFEVWRSVSGRPSRDVLRREERVLRTQVLRRMAGHVCRDPLQLHALASFPWLSTQEEVLRLEVLVRSGEAGHRYLAERLLRIDSGPGGPSGSTGPGWFRRQGPEALRLTLEAIAIPGAAADLLDVVEPLVHHEEHGVRSAAIGCVRAIGGEEAVRRATAGVDSWPRYRVLMSGRDAQQLVVFGMDESMPLPLRERVLRRAMWDGYETPGGGSVKVVLLNLLSSPEPSLRGIALASCWRHARSIWRDTSARPSILRAFAGGSRDVRERLGASIRRGIGLSTPGAEIANQVLLIAEGPIEETMVSLLSELRLPASELARRLGPMLLAAQPQRTIAVLNRCSSEVLAALEPSLVDELERGSGLPDHIAAVLVRIPAGRKAVIRFADRLSESGRLPLLASAGADLMDHLEEITASVRKGTASVRNWPDLEVLAKLPWRDRPADLAELAGLVGQLWSPRSEEGLVRMLDLLAAMGPSADFASGDLKTMLTDDRHTAERAAAALLAIGHGDPVRAWLLELFATGKQQQFSVASVRIAWSDLIAARLAEAQDDEIVALAQKACAQADLPVAARTTIALRLITQSEAAGGTPLLGARWVEGPLDPAAEPEFAAFLERRRATGNRPDPFASVVVGLALRSFPAMCFAAIRDGLIDTQLLDGRLVELDDPILIERFADDLLALAVPRHRPDLAESVGRMLARLRCPPLDKMVGGLDDPARRHFTLRALGAMGSKALPAMDAIAALAAADDDSVRFLAGQVLAELGPAGITRVGALLNNRPELIGVVDFVLARGDAADVVAVANLLLTLPTTAAEVRAKVIREAIARQTDVRARSMLTLALLRFDPVGRDEDWLGVASLEPAIVRRRAIECMFDQELTLLQLGVLAERLDDEDVGVRNAAARALLAVPVRVDTCRAALTEFAAREDLDPELAQRVRTALAAAK